MHAVLITVTIDPSQAPAAAAALMSDIMPKVTSAPGYRAGYWLEPDDGRGLSIVLVETQEQASQLAQAASEWSVPGVALADVQIRRVAVSVP